MLTLTLGMFSCSDITDGDREGGGGRGGGRGRGGLLLLLRAMIALLNIINEVSSPNTMCPLDFVIIMKA